MSKSDYMRTYQRKRRRKLGEMTMEERVELRKWYVALKSGHITPEGFQKSVKNLIKQFSPDEDYGASD